LDDIDNLRARGFGQPVGFGLKPALLVVDFVNGFTDPQSPLGANVDREIAAANELIDASRRAGSPVLFSTIAYTDEGLQDAGVWARKIGPLTELRFGSSGVLPDPRLHRRADDVVLEKKYASCFFGTDLHDRLQRLDVDTLLVAGCSTSGCVRATVVDACQLGLRPIIALEAVADRSEAAHRQSLLDIEMKYGDVQPVARIAAYLARLPRAVPGHAARA
jgi:nicotinamidase-related amidase